MHGGTRDRSGNPAARAVGECAFPVETCRELEREPRTAAFEAAEETAVDAPRRLFSESDFDFDARTAQGAQPRTRDARIGILDRSDDAAYAGGNQHRRTGPRATLMSTGFQRDIDGRIPRLLARGRERKDFGMRLARPRVKSLADDTTVAHDHAAHGGIRRAGTQAAHGQTQRASHPAFVIHLHIEPALFAFPD